MSGLIAAVEKIGQMLQTGLQDLIATLARPDVMPQVLAPAYLGVPELVVRNEGNAKETTIIRERQSLLMEKQSHFHETTQKDVSLRPLLEAILQKLDRLAERPVEVTVKTHLDGRQIAESVYRDMREQKIRNYETL